MASPVYPYFYPLTPSCPVRNQRAIESGYEVVDETFLAQEARPLYPGHKQPIIHCLGDVAIKNWDDMNISSVEKQNELALDYGVDGFIFDSFLGIKNGKRYHEMGGVLDNTWLRSQSSRALRFGTMAILASPRIALPVSNVDGYREASRDYDISRATIRAIVDHAAGTYWEKENHMTVKNRPYISMFIALNRLPAYDDDLTVYETFEYLKEYSVKSYGIDPYLLAVAQGADQAVPAAAHGADAVSSYALLPDFSKNAAPVQGHSLLLEQRIEDWHAISNVLNVPYVPPAVVGWDASPRGVNGVSLNEVAGIYPFTPIVEGSTSSLFDKMLAAQDSFTQKHVPADERYIPINAWNEITEGSALLPRISEDGTMDTNFLDIIKMYKETSVMELGH